MGTDFGKTLIDDERLSSVFWVILVAKGRMDGFKTMNGSIPDFGWLTDHPRVWCDLEVANCTDNKGTLHKESPKVQNDVLQINKEAVDDRIRLLSIWMFSQPKIQTAINRWVLYSNDDAITMGKEGVEGKNSCWGKDGNIYNSLYSIETVELPQYKVGEEIEAFSKKTGKWVRAKVTGEAKHSIKIIGSGKKVTVGGDRLREKVK